jgi:alcohol dehydrogenase YqhD (iron-dependent ADH family)
VMENLEVLLIKPDDLAARTNISWCSTMALLGPVNLGRPGAFPLHFVEHALSGHYDIAHGRGLAIMLPPLMRYTYKVRPQKYAALARNIFFAEIDNMDVEQAALTFIEKFEEWMKSVGMFSTLSDVQIGSEKFEAMADDTIALYGGGKDFIYSNKKLYRDDLIKLFEMAQ